MQKCPIYLYTNLLTVTLDLDQNTRVHNIMYQHDLKIQKGLKNKIQIQFKNSDQKLLNVSSGTYVFSMFDSNNQRQLISKVVSLIDDGITTSTRGLGLLELNESDTLDLDNGYYKFTVAARDTDGSYTPTYANTYYGISGTLEIRQDSYPVLMPSTEVTSFQSQYNRDVMPQRFEWYSGNLQAHPEFNSNSALHTMAFYMKNFKGQVVIEGTQQNSPGYFGDYSVVATETYNQFTGVDYANFNGVFSFVRIRYIPDSLNTGTFDKLLYRS